MYIIHLYWHHKGHLYKNDGNLKLWIEQSTPIKSSKTYPYQIESKQLLEWAANNFNITISQTEVDTVYLPVNTSDKEIPSPVIANINNIEDTEGKS